MLLRMLEDTRLSVAHKIKSLNLKWCRSLLSIFPNEQYIQFYLYRQIPLQSFTNINFLLKIQHNQAFSQKSDRAVWSHAWI
jgi:transcription elongation factor